MKNKTKRNNDDNSDEEKPRPKKGPNSGLSKCIWTTEEDRLLLEVCEEYEGKKWKAVAEKLKNKSNVQCQSRYNRIKPGMKKANWEKDEDTIITNYILKHGTNPSPWAKIKDILEYRTVRQIRDRYYNILDRNADKSPFTDEDDRKLKALYEKYGSKWKHISTFFTNRLPDTIKNRYYSYLRVMNKSTSKNKRNNFTEVEPRLEKLFTEEDIKEIKEVEDIPEEEKERDMNNDTGTSMSHGGTHNSNYLYKNEDMSTYMNASPQVKEEVNQSDTILGDFLDGPSLNYEDKENLEYLSRKIKEDDL